MSRSSFLVRWFLGLGALPTLPACVVVEPGDDRTLPAEGAGPVPADAPASGHDDRALPPDDWAPPLRAARRAGPARLCLLFDGVDVDPDESFIVRRGRTTHVPAFDPAPYGVRDRLAAIGHVLERVRAHFAATELEISEGATPESECTRIVIGGRPTLVGESMEVAGIAPFDVGNRLPDDLGFAFSEVLGTGRGTPDLDQLAAVVAHEAGHTFGLDHVESEIDLMFPTVNDRMRGFTAAETLDGVWQDAPAILREVLGAQPDDEPDASDEPPRAKPDCDPPGDASGESREDARLVAVGRPTGGRSCAGDEDWFAVDLAVGDAVELTLSFPDEGWVEPPELFRPRGRTPVGEAFAEGANHHLVAVADRAGRHRLRIRSPDAAPTRYALRVDVTPAR